MHILFEVHKVIIYSLDFECRNVEKFNGTISIQIRD